jgi:dynein heavy chain, axonemal
MVNGSPICHTCPLIPLHLPAQVRRLYTLKRTELLDSKDRYDKGLDKLLKTGEQVAEMQSELAELKPRLILKTAQAEEMMATIADDQTSAESYRLFITQEEAECEARNEEALRLKGQCEADLSEAMPALHAALRALKSLSKKDIAEVRAMKRPPKGVKLTMETVCLMKGLKAKPTRGEDCTDVLDFWDPALKMMSDVNFLQVSVSGVSISGVR